MTDDFSIHLDEVIKQAIKEDIGDGDHTSLAIFGPEVIGKARLLVKERGILAGIPVALKVFERLDPSLKTTVYINDGEEITTGDIAFEVRGSILSILSAERLVLNFMQRLSGIATLTHEIVNQLSGLKTKVLDTRKTTPGLRELEKYAVRVGGGSNHRMGLYDMILIKDNHVDFAKGVVNAIESVHKYLKTNDKKLKIEIEVRNFEELLDVIAYGRVDRIMLDNFLVEDVHSAVQLVAGRFETEASGGIRKNNVREYAETGVDYISIGAFTHNFRSLDMSLKAVRKELWEDDD
jgi:nicotinate-nucleotide pyrophosphorylase (carboxylating)